MNKENKTKNSTNQTKEKTNIPSTPQKQKAFRPKQKNKSLELSR